MTRSIAHNVPARTRTHLAREERRIMTILPEAHEFEPSATGRRCAQCDRRRKFGVHRSSPSRVQVSPHASRATYRTSGTPYMARPAIWNGATR